MFSLYQNESQFDFVYKYKKNIYIVQWYFPVLLKGVHCIYYYFMSEIIDLLDSHLRDKRIINERKNYGRMINVDECKHIQKEFFV